MIIYFDQNGKQLEPLDFVEIQWTRKYSEVGDFSIYLPASEWNSEVKYIQNTERKETGIVQKIVYDKNGSNFITASGFFLEKLAFWGANYLNVSLGGATTSAQVRDLIASHFAETFAYASNNAPYPTLYSVTLDADSDLPSSMDYNVNMGTPTGQFLYDFLSTSNRSYYCKPVFNPSPSDSLPNVGIDVVAYKGKDLTDKVYFSEGFADVEKMSYTIDESAEAPLYVVMQEIEYASGFDDVVTINTAQGLKHYIYENIVVDTNRPTGVGKAYPIKVIQGSVADIEMVSANQAAIRAQMIQQGKVDMLDHYKIETISCDVIQNTFFYLKDYDLGDVCTVVIDDIQQMFTARISEIHEVHRNNGVEIELVLGTPQKTKYRKVQA